MHDPLREKKNREVSRFWIRHSKHTFVFYNRYKFYWPTQFSYENIMLCKSLSLSVLVSFKIDVFICFGFTVALLYFVERFIEMHSTGAPDSGLKRYTTSTLGQLAFIGGRKRVACLGQYAPSGSPQ